MDTVIEVNHLGRTFEKRAAVDGITFHVKHGEVFGLLGPNGAGKTTTVRLLNGLLPPSFGAARILGLDPVSQGSLIRQKTGVLMETPAPYERLSAYENLAFFGTLHGVSDRELPRRVEEMLAFFGLSARANDKVETYSKGMKQRLALARALIHNPPLLFLDEPTSGLDPEAAQQVNDLIASLTAQAGKTVVLATHNLNEAQRLCDRVAILNKGKVLALGGLQELSQRLWPVTWVDIHFSKPPAADTADRLTKQRGILQAILQQEDLAVQVDNESVIPEVVRYLVELDVSIRKVTPRDYTLKDIYFALQAGEA